MVHALVPNSQSGNYSLTPGSASELRKIKNEFQKQDLDRKLPIRTEKLTWTGVSDAKVSWFDDHYAVISYKKDGEDKYTYDYYYDANKDGKLSIEDGEKISINQFEFDASEILVYRSPRPGTQALTNRLITIDMVCTLDQDLIDEGLAREMVNRIQKTRKDLNFNVSDRIEINIHTTPELARVFLKFENYISQETLMMKGSISDKKIINAVEHEIDESSFDVLANKV
jgi:hypothetical protein